MATEPQKICPPTPRKAARRFEVPATSKIADTSFAIDCIGIISSYNSNQIILDSELFDKKVVQIQNTNILVHIGKAIDNYSNQNYQASISQNGHVIIANCVLKTRNIIPSIANYYDDKTSIQRMHTFSVTNSLGLRIDFTKFITKEEDTAVKRLKTEDSDKSLNATSLQWREKPLPLSLMFQQSSTELSLPSNERSESNTPTINQ